MVLVMAQYVLCLLVEMALVLEGTVCQSEDSTCAQNRSPVPAR